jgi:phage recombination protein Bet
MAKTQTQTKKQTTPEQQGNGQAQPPAIRGPRLPYHPAVEERFGIDKAGWKALVEAVFPAAQETESVILALSYCKARGLDPFKRNVHIVPIWDKQKRRMVDTVWPGIGELRTTAFRTGLYAGRAPTEFGRDLTETWQSEKGPIEVTFPEWAQVTVYRIVNGQRVEFAGPPVYWLETFASSKDGEPNSMWRKRPRGQLDKCAEAAALRAAFPEELGDQQTDGEAGILQHAPNGISAEQAGAQPVEQVDGASRTDALADQLAGQSGTDAGTAAETTGDDAMGDAIDPPEEAEGQGEAEAEHIGDDDGATEASSADAAPVDDLAARELADDLVARLAQACDCDDEPARRRLEQFCQKVKKCGLYDIDEDAHKDIAARIERGDIAIDSAGAGAS